MSLIGSLIMGIIIGCLMWWLENDFSLSIERTIMNSLTLAAIVMLVNWLVPMLPAVVALLILLIVLAVMALLVLHWREYGNSAKQLVILSIVDGILCWEAGICAAKIWDLTQIKWIGVAITSIPIMLLVLSIGYFIVDAIKFQYVLRGGNANEED